MEKVQAERGRCHTEDSTGKGPTMLTRLDEQRTEATSVYLKIGHNLIRSYTDKNLSVEERSNLAWLGVCFVRLWKAWIEMSSYSVESSFTSLQTYNDTVIAGHTIALLMTLFSEHIPDELFNP